MIAKVGCRLTLCRGGESAAGDGRPQGGGTGAGCASYIASSAPTPSETYLAVSAKRLPARTLKVAACPSPLNQPLVLWVGSLPAHAGGLGRETGAREQKTIGVMGALLEETASLDARVPRSPRLYTPRYMLLPIQTHTRVLGPFPRHVFSQTWHARPVQ